MNQYKESKIETKTKYPKIQNYVNQYKKYVGKRKKENPMKGIKKVNTSSYNNRRLITIMLVTREDIDNKEIEYGKENEKENDIRERGKETNENDS